MPLLNENVNVNIDNTDDKSINNTIIKESNKNISVGDKSNKRTYTNKTDNMDKSKDEKNDDDDDDDNDDDEEEVILSLDSSDSEDEPVPISRSGMKTHHFTHLSQCSYSNSSIALKNKYKYGHNNKYGHRSKFSLNRSKSTSTPSASMSTLLRANHIRNHKYNGILKNKYKKKTSTYDQKSDSVVNRHNSHKHNHLKHNDGPKFNPEHVFLSKSNRITINVGGSLYETTLNTLSADQSSMLSAMFSGRFNIEKDKDKDNSIFIDRDPTHFRQFVFAYLRNWK